MHNVHVHFRISLHPIRFFKKTSPQRTWMPFQILTFHAQAPAAAAVHRFQSIQAPAHTAIKQIKPTFIQCRPSSCRFQSIQALPHTAIK
jgi:hypothetical protein